VKVTVRSTNPRSDLAAPDAMPAEEFIETVNRIHARISEMIIGKPQAIGLAMLTLLARGHLLIEDVPGVGKTELAKALAGAVGGTMHRIQFTPDLLPSDVTGSSVFNMATREFEFRPGPVFANIVLADEINRSSPKTQSALLECMGEAQVSIDATTHLLGDPFFVIATQNPIDMAGTYPLPEPQRDRFMARISIGYPDAAAEDAMLLSHGSAGPSAAVEPVVDLPKLRRMMAYTAQIHAAAPIRRHVVAIAQATRTHPSVALGASPRAAIHLLRAACARAALAGRSYVVPDDVDALVLPVLTHRIILRPEASAGGASEAEVVRDVVARVPVPDAGLR
jgi:MoxR-like ATPase